MTPSLWLPDAPPISAGAEDDEFDGNSAGVPPGWTEVDHGAHLVVDEDSVGLQLTQATHVGESVSGVYRAIPAGDFTIWTKVSLSSISLGTAAQGGLALWEDATNSAGDVVTLALASNATTRVESRTAYNAAATLLDAEQWQDSILPSHMYLRIRRASTTYDFEVSYAGVGFHRHYTTAALGFVPTHFGPVLWNVATGVTVGARFPFFRYLASDVGLTGLPQGDRIQIAAV